MLHVFLESMRKQWRKRKLKKGQIKILEAEYRKKYEDDPIFSPAISTVCDVEADEPGLTDVDNIGQDDTDLTPLRQAELTERDLDYQQKIEKFEDFANSRCKEDDKESAVNTKGVCGVRELHLAVEEGNFERVKELVEKKGADPLKPNNSGFTPRQYCIVISGSKKIATYLLQVEKKIKSKQDEPED